MKTKNTKWIHILGETSLFIAGLALYGWIVLAPHSHGFRNFLTSIVHERTLLLAGILLFFLLAYLIPGWIGRSVRWVGWVSLFGFFLAGYWLVKRTFFFTVYGILPYVDATEYYANAQRLLLNIPAQGTTIGRPLFSSFFAGIYWFCHNNIQISLVVLVALVAIAVYLLEESVFKHFAALPAAFVASFTFMWFRNYLGGVSSESLGLIFGCLGFAILLETFKRPALKYYLGGMFLLTLALVTRAGPFFILPFIFLAFFFIFNTKIDRIKYTVGSAISIGAGFILNSGVLKILSHNQSYLFPNYLYSLYGMAAGGQGWAFIKGDRPDLMALAEPLRTQKIYDATLTLIKAHPLVFIWNLLKQYWYFVLYGNTSIFSYLFTNIDWFNIVMMVILYGLCILAIVLMIRNRKQLIPLVLLAIVVGVVLSVPFVPPQDEAYMRAFAVAVPLMALIPAYALDWLVQKGFAKLKSRSTIFEKFQRGPEPAGSWVMLPAAYSVLILAVAFGAALFLNGVEQKTVAASSTCPAGEIPYVWMNVPANNVKLANKTSGESVNEINTTQVDRLMHDIYTSERMPLFLSFHPGITVSEQVNYLDGAGAWVLAPNSMDLSKQGLIQGCGVWHKDTEQYLFDFIQISSGSPIQ